MPEIPLYNGGESLKLGKLPGPVLDREQRGGVNFSGPIQGINKVMQSAQGLSQAMAPVLINPNALAGKNQGMQALAHGVEALGDVFAGLANREMEAKNYADAADGKLQMNMAQAEFEQWKAANPGNPEAWNGEWQKRLVALGKQIGKNDTWSDAVRERMGVEFKNFSGLSSIDVATSATKATFRRGAEAANGAVRQGYLNRDMNAVTEGLAQRQRFTGETNEAAGAEALEYKQRIEHDQRNDLATASPRVFLEELQKPAKDRAEFMQDMNSADDELGRQHAISALENGKAGILDEIHERLKSGDIIDANDFYRKRGNGLIDPNHFLDDDDVIATGNMIAHPINDPALFEKTHSLISAYNAHSDETGVERATIAQEIDKTFKGPLRDELQGQLKEQEKRTAPLGPDAFDSIFTQALGELNDSFERGDFGVYKVPSSKVTWDKERGSWVRERYSWEPAGGTIAIKLGQDDAMKLTEGGKKIPDFVTDQRAKDKAAEEVTKRRTRLKKQWDEGKYATPNAMLDEFKASMNGAVKASAAKALNKDTMAEPYMPGTSPRGTVEVDPVKAWDAIKAK